MNDYREYDDYLAHYGIMGMRWGVRRYQNSDGSLTPEGMKRYKSQHRHEIRDDAKILSQHRYNEAIKDAKSKVKSGEYDKYDYKKAKEKAKYDKKKMMEDTEQFLKKTVDEKDIYKRFEKLRGQTIKEMGANKYRAVTGSKIVNNMLTAGHAGFEAAGLAAGVASLATGGVPIYGIIVSAGVGGAAGAGIVALRRRFNTRVIDALT